MSEVGPSERDRRLVLEGAAQLLADSKPRTAREIAEELSKLGAWVDKSLVNSVLTREGKEQFIYSLTNFTYRLFGSEVVGEEYGNLPNTAHEYIALLCGARMLLADGGLLIAKEMAASLRGHGLLCEGA